MSWDHLTQIPRGIIVSLSPSHIWDILVLVFIPSSNASLRCCSFLSTSTPYTPFFATTALDTICTERSINIMTTPPQAEKPKARPKIVTWGDRIAWLGRMPLRYKILFGTQSIIFGLAVRFRFVDLNQAQLKIDQKETDDGAAPSTQSSWILRLRLKYGYKDMLGFRASDYQVAVFLT